MRNLWGKTVTGLRVSAPPSHVTVKDSKGNIIRYEQPTFYHNIYAKRRAKS